MHACMHPCEHLCLQVHASLWLSRHPRGCWPQRTSARSCDVPFVIARALPARRREKEAKREDLAQAVEAERADAARAAADSADAARRALQQSLCIRAQVRRQVAKCAGGRGDAQWRAAAAVRGLQGAGCAMSIGSSVLTDT